MIYSWSHSKVGTELELFMTLDSWLLCIGPYKDYVPEKPEYECQGRLQDYVRYRTLWPFSWPDLIFCGLIVSYHLWTYLKPEVWLWGPLGRLEDLHQLSYPLMTSSNITSSRTTLSIIPPRNNYTFSLTPKDSYLCIIMVPFQALYMTKWSSLILSSWLNMESLESGATSFCIFFLLSLVQFLYFLRCSVNDRWLDRLALILVKTLWQ